MKKVFLLLVCFLLIGCSSDKELNEVTVDNFKSIMDSNSLDVSDNISSYNNVQYISDAYIAKYQDDISIEYIVYDNEEDAEKIVNSHIKSFNMLKSTGASEVNETGKNYHKYILISNNYYMTSNRINKTVIFCKTKLTNKNKVEKILSDMGI